MIAAIAGSFSTGSNILASGDVSATAQPLMQFVLTIQNFSWGDIFNPMFYSSFFNSVFDIMLLNFPVFHEGPWVIIRWVILAPIIGTVVYGIVITAMSMFRRTI